MEVATTRDVGYQLKQGVRRTLQGRALPGYWRSAARDPGQRPGCRIPFWRACRFISDPQGFALASSEQGWFSRWPGCKTQDALLKWAELVQVLVDDLSRPFPDCQAECDLCMIIVKQNFRDLLSWTGLFVHRAGFSYSLFTALAAIFEASPFSLHSESG